MQVLSPLRVLLVGCGQIAGGYDHSRPPDSLPLSHAGAYCRHGGFELTGCVEPDQARRHDFMQRWNIPQGWDALDHIDVSSYEVDVISICSPTARHAENVSQSLRLQPRLLFCEKPMAATFEAARNSIAVCEAAGVAIAVNYTRRWAPDVVGLAADLHRGRRGTVRSVVGRYNKGIMHNGGHLVDLIRQLFGELCIEWVGSPVHDFWPDDPTVPACLRSTHGVPIYLDTAHADDYACFELHITTSRGILSLEEGGMRWRSREAAPCTNFAGYRSLSEGHFSDGRYGEAMLAAVHNLYHHLRNGTPLASTGHNALATQAICEAIKQASQSLGYKQDHADSKR